METLKKKILKALELNNFSVNDLSFLAGDASDRKYFLAKSLKKEFVIMVDKNRDNLNQFLKITKALEKKVSVPKIYKYFKNDGLAIIENFGKSKYSEIINQSNSKELYKLAVENLISIQNKKLSVILPRYSTKKFLDESNLFFDWYLPFFNFKGGNMKKEFNLIFRDFLKKLEKLPQVFVHRDYHIDNLFFLKNRKGILKCGWIDYQDAVYGPSLYDLVSLTQDARIDVNKNIENFLVNFYIEQKKITDKDLFHFCYSLLGIQRHLKVLGIFCRLSKRDKKNIYLSHLPRVKKMLLSNLMKKKFTSLYSLLGPIIENG